MSISMYSASVPAFARLLANMNQWLDAARVHAEAKKFDPAVYLTLRLTPDMLAFPRQIQIASDAAKGCVARLAGQEVPSWPDDETSLEQLAARIARTRDFVLSVPAEAFNGSEDRDIVIPRRDAEPRRFKGETYLHHFAMPNFYFHATMTYALLREAGVPLGKADYLGAL
ncbi:MAG: DUF1993 domain-containing protein [Paucibacter sp.]|nr:DUF1993 domain-containing protein [Roseateles sp.]